LFFLVKLAAWDKSPLSNWKKISSVMEASMAAATKNKWDSNPKLVN